MVDPTANEEADLRTSRTAREAEGYYELGLYEQALERAETLLREGKLERFARAMRAECLRSLGRWEEGSAAFREILASDPEDVSAYVGLGWCERRAGRLDGAIEAMERLLEVRPAEPIGLYNLACYCALKGDGDRALELLSHAVRANPRFRELAAAEEDFVSLREDPRFREIIARRRS